MQGDGDRSGLSPRPEAPRPPSGPVRTSGARAGSLPGSVQEHNPHGVSVTKIHMVVSSHFDAGTSFAHSRCWGLPTYWEYLGSVGGTPCLCIRLARAGIELPPCRFVYGAAVRRAPPLGPGRGRRALTLAVRLGHAPQKTADFGKTDPKESAICGRFRLGSVISTLPE